MDSSHVALVSLSLAAEGFQNYRSDKPITLGNSLVVIGRNQYGQSGKSDEAGRK
jgi:hypothetical protein